MTDNNHPPVALTVAGSDSGGGAGIQADLKTFAAHGVHGTTALTALTAQNTQGVRAIHAAPPAFVAAQIDAVAEDMAIAAVKTGMLFDAPIIRAAADAFRRHGIQNLVVDPVMISTSGHALIDPAARQALIEEMIPLAAVLTPNADEAAVLADMTITGRDDMATAARRILTMGCRSVLIKGGNIDGGDGQALDLWTDGTKELRLQAPRHRDTKIHGAGCVLSAAIAASLAQGHPLPEAIQRAKRFISGAIENALTVGRGLHPANPLWAIHSVRR